MPCHLHSMIPLLRPPLRAPPGHLLAMNGNKAIRSLVSFFEFDCTQVSMYSAVVRSRAYDAWGWYGCIITPTYIAHRDWPKMLTHASAARPRASSAHSLSTSLTTPLPNPRTSHTSSPPEALSQSFHLSHLCTPHATAAALPSKADNAKTGAAVPDLAPGGAAAEARATRSIFSDSEEGSETSSPRSVATSTVRRTDTKAMEEDGNVTVVTVEQEEEEVQEDVQDALCESSWGDMSGVNAPLLAGSQSLLAAGAVMLVEAASEQGSGEDLAELHEASGVTLPRHEKSGGGADVADTSQRQMDVVPPLDFERLHADAVATDTEHAPEKGETTRQEDQNKNLQANASSALAVTRLDAKVPPFLF